MSEERQTKVVVTRITFSYPKPFEIPEEFLPELEVMGLHYNKETQAFEIADMAKVPLMLAFVGQVHNLKTLDDMKSFIRSISEQMQESH